MDKQKEIEKMKFVLASTIHDCEQKDCIRNCEFARQKDCKYFRAAKDLQTEGYGDVHAAVKETAQDIFSWIYRNLVNLNFLTGNVEINLLALDTFAKTYGVDLFDISRE